MSESWNCVNNSTWANIDWKLWTASSTPHWHKPVWGTCSAVTRWCTNTSATSRVTQGNFYRVNESRKLSILWNLTSATQLWMNEPSHPSHALIWEVHIWSTDPTMRCGVTGPLPRWRSCSGAPRSCCTPSPGCRTPSPGARCPPAPTCWPGTWRAHSGWGRSRSPRGWWGWSSAAWRSCWGGRWRAAAAGPACSGTSPGAGWRTRRWRGSAWPRGSGTSWTRPPRGCSVRSRRCTGGAASRSPWGGERRRMSPWPWRSEGAQSGERRRSGR